MRLIKQKTEYDCCAAVVAMLCDISLDEAKRYFPVDFNKEGVCVRDVECLLARLGFWLNPEFRHWCNIKQDLELSSRGLGFAQVEFKGGLLHLVAIDERNKVFDPSRDEPCSFGDYERINSVFSIRKF